MVLHSHPAWEQAVLLLMHGGGFTQYVALQTRLEFAQMFSWPAGQEVAGWHWLPVAQYLPVPHAGVLYSVVGLHWPPMTRHLPLEHSQAPGAHPGVLSHDVVGEQVARLFGS